MPEGREGQDLRARTPEGREGQDPRARTPEGRRTGERQEGPLPDTRKPQAGRAPEPGGPREPHGAPGAPPAAPARDPAAVRQFIERFASLLADSGMPRMPARIFVALLTADTSSLTADELAGLLQVSPAAVSGGVRYLVQVGLVSRETEAGSRRHVYRMPGNVWHEVLRVRDRIMMRWADTMRDGADVFGAGTPAGGRLAESAMYFDFVSKELPALLDRWEEYKAAHRD